KEQVQALVRGLDYLVEHQNEDGSWSNLFGFKWHDDYIRSGEGPHAGISALAGLAILSTGRKPEVGRYGTALSKAKDFILGCGKYTGGYIIERQSRMYSHAYAGLFLAELYGMTGDRRIKEKLDGAIALSVAGQAESGGWGYTPFDHIVDLTITVPHWQYMTVAKGFGVRVPQESLDRAMKYIDGSRFGPDEKGRSGAYCYELALKERSRITFGTTACGLSTSTFVAGEPLDKLTSSGFFQLESRRASRSGAEVGRKDYHYFFSHFYAMQAFSKSGGKRWVAWWRTVSREILNAQRADGSWIDEIGPHYATAMAILILSAPTRNLAVYKVD
ncbi:MAG: prenyltransferase/squalene oxidase repeat-containing protein, partial [Planctomycetota bacterium]